MIIQTNITTDLTIHSLNDLTKPELFTSKKNAQNYQTLFQFF